MIVDFIFFMGIILGRGEGKGGRELYFLGMGWKEVEVGGRIGVEKSQG